MHLLCLANLILRYVSDKFPYAFCFVLISNIHLLSFSFQFYVLPDLIKQSAGFVFTSYVSDFSLASETIKMETFYNSLTFLITHMFLFFYVPPTNSPLFFCHYPLM